MGAEKDGVVSYSNFRNFVMLLPAKKLQGLDPNLLWFNATSSIPFGEVLLDAGSHDCCGPLSGIHPSRACALVVTEHLSRAGSSPSESARPEHLLLKGHCFDLCVSL